jgi:hypothetical protein
VLTWFYVEIAAMWKRFQGQARERDRQIGNPVLLETTYDENQLMRNPNITDFQNQNYEHYAAPR